VQGQQTNIYRYRCGLARNGSSASSAENMPTLKSFFDFLWLNMVFPNMIDAIFIPLNAYPPHSSCL
jgi:hypothetical protein